MSENAVITQKIMLLYIVKRVSGLTWHQWMNTALSTLFVDYFTFGTLADTLQQDGLVQVAQQKGETRTDANGQRVSCCYLTPAGEHILEAMTARLPLALIQNLNRLTDALNTPPNQPGIQASHTASDRGDRMIKLSLQDNGRDALTLQCIVPTDTLAEAICDHWRHNAESLYGDLMSLLYPLTAATSTTAPLTVDDHDADHAADEPLDSPAN